MSFSLFGRPRAAPPTKPVIAADLQGEMKQTILSLAGAKSDKLKLMDHYDRKIEQCDREARERVLKADKEGAKRCLRNKQIYLQQRDQANGQLSNLELVELKLQNAANVADMAAVMQGAAVTLKAAVNVVNVDTIEDMQDQIQEHIETLDEAASTLARPLGVPGAGAADLDDQLAALVSEMEAEAAAKKPAAATVAPVAAPVVAPAAEVPAHMYAMPEIPSGVPVAAPAATQQHQRVAVAAGGAGGPIDPLAELAALS